MTSVSPIVIEDEYKHATETGMAPLVGLALLLIAALILLFMRTLSDLLLTLGGLIISVSWIVGAEGWLGPDGLGWIGPPSSVSTMVPIIVISLTVDYAIQAVSHYRERRLEGEPVLEAIRTGLHNVGVPIVLAAVTTIASFLSILFSPIGVIGDFGIVAALGVALSMIVMLSLVPAGRTIIDRRREARGKLKEPRPVSGALPRYRTSGRGVRGGGCPPPGAHTSSRCSSVTGAFGFAATGLHSVFSIRDILPRGGTVLNDLETLEAAVGGSTEQARVLVKAEATDTRTLLNVRDLTDGFRGRATPPAGGRGTVGGNVRFAGTRLGPRQRRARRQVRPRTRRAIRGSRGRNVQTRSGTDAGCSSTGSRQWNPPWPAFWPTIRTERTRSCSSSRPSPTIRGQPRYSRRRSRNSGKATTMPSRPRRTSVLAVAITDQITDGQTASISTTVAVALGILAIFFWVTLRRPTLSVIAVGPIVLVLIWVLGTMALLDIPYSLITSIITALSIGIGVDYTIHVIHRYREEFSRVRNPEKAAIRTLATTGSALLGSALTTAFGFGVLAFSPLDGSRQFGITAAITIGYSLLVSIVVVPPAMTVWGAYENMRLRSTVQRLWDDIDVAAEEVYQRHAEEQGASAG